MIQCPVVVDIEDSNLLIIEEVKNCDNLFESLLSSTEVNGYVTDFEAVLGEAGKYSPMIGWKQYNTHFWLVDAVMTRLCHQPGLCKDCVVEHQEICDHADVGVLFSGGKYSNWLKWNNTDLWLVYTELYWSLIGQDWTQLFSLTWPHSTPHLTRLFICTTSHFNSQMVDTMFLTEPLQFKLIMNWRHCCLIIISSWSWSTWLVMNYNKSDPIMSVISCILSTLFLMIALDVQYGLLLEDQVITDLWLVDA